MASPSRGSIAGGQAERGIVPGTSPSEMRPSTASLGALAGVEGRSEVLERYGALAARILISQIFLISGVMKIVDWSGTEAEMAKHGMFWIPIFHVAAMLVELGAGLSLLLGCKTRLGALVLFLYLIPVTLTFHHFWSDPPDQQKVNMLFFLHNLALMGGLLLLMAWGPGALSLDCKGRKCS